jgi:hypothetical protein
MPVHVKSTIKQVAKSDFCTDRTMGLEVHYILLRVVSIGFLRFYISLTVRDFGSHQARKTLL